MSTWSEMQTVIGQHSTYVNFHNFLLDHGAEMMTVDFNEFMNGPIRDKLKIIPATVVWGRQGQLVFNGFADEFMKPRIAEVDELLSKGVNVVVYNGQGVVWELI
ncbi:Serine carboxypeptidase-like 51 [Tripterygium wilfordii]|uniref:Serine carboxypeptidase-like 51 n=1 Tax=Tripterygium wilfordii TaxID=458696 RepID=A0A7J7BWI5_TRIWF|nr:Serine carboxypeptidase-like 51 [Tripterygium wilfordii]